jgi:hypothetical protein
MSAVRDAESDSPSRNELPLDKVNISILHAGGHMLSFLSITVPHAATSRTASMPKHHRVTRIAIPARPGRNDESPPPRGLDPRRWRQATPWLWYLAAALMIVASGFAVIFNGDLWFHLAAGRWMLQHEAVPYVDSWSYTAAGHAWHDHEWLAQLIFQLWTQAFGLSSLMIWKWLLLLVIFLPLLDLLRRLGASLAASFLILCFTLWLSTIFFEIRPHLYTLLFTVVVLRAVFLRAGPRWLLPLVFVLWANLHAGVVFGLGLLSLLLLLDAFDAPGGRELRRRAALLLACLGATLLNPYGTGVLTYPLSLLPSHSASRDVVVEWQSPFAPGGPNTAVYPWALAVLGVAVILLFATGTVRLRRRESRGALAVAAVTLAMSLTSRRFIPLFAVGASPLLALAFGGMERSLDRWRSARRHSAGSAGPAGPAGSPGPVGPGRPEGPADAAPSAAPERRAPSIRQTLLALLAVAAGCLMLRPSQLPPQAFRATTLSYFLPVDTLDFVAANRLRGKVFAFYPWGGYVDWRTAGGLQVYIDSRADTLFDAATQRAYDQVQKQGTGWEEIVEGSGAQWVLWPRQTADHGTLVRQLIFSGRWLRVHQDAVSVLLARNDTPLADPLLLPAESAYRDFAAAQDAFALDRLPEAEQLLLRALDLMPDLGPACRDLVKLEGWLGKKALAPSRVVPCKDLERREQLP